MIKQLEQINILKIDNDTNCLRDEIILNKNKKYKYLKKFNIDEY